ncbi:MAG: hypothetical protein GY947_08905, partial [Rhodobacteraceae bacterium]|nr:hypothetical protein [Paracoccaceae bacterium]
MTKKLALVVHGIGEQSAGNTLDHLVGAVTGDVSCVVTSEERMLREDHHDMDPRSVDLFPCNIRRVTCTNTKCEGEDPDSLVFAEVFWGDLSRGGSGRIATLIELFRVIMGLGHIVRENIEEVPNTPALVKKAANAFVYLLHGPITVLNIVFVLGTLALFAVQRMAPWAQILRDYSGSIAVLLVAAALSVVWFFGQNEKQSYLFQIFWTWMRFTPVGLVALVLITHGYFATTQDADIQKAFTFLNVQCAPRYEDGFRGCLDHWYTSILLNLISLVWFVCILLVASLVVRQAFVDRREAQNRHQTLFPTTCAAMIVMWMFLAVIGWVSFANTLESMAPGNWETLQVNLPQAISLSVFVWLAFLVLLAHAVRSILKRASWVKKHKDDAGQHGAVPRVIISPSVRRGLMWGVIILLFGAIWVGSGRMNLTWQGSINAWLSGGISWVAGLFNLQVPDSNDTQKLVNLISTVTNYAALALAFVYSIAWNQISVGLGIAKDIVVYFVRRPVPGLENKPGVTKIEENGVQYLLVPKRVVKNGQASTQTEKIIVYPNRTRIQQRFKIVYEALLECEKPDEVVVVSHSQGTLIALESLRDGRLENQISGYVRPTLITMGSPTWHIYNYYFASDFPIDTTVRDGIARWVN